MYICCSNTRWDFEEKKSDRSSQNWAGHRGNAKCSHHYLINVQEPLLGHISWWVITWAVQLISIVSLRLQDCLHQCSLTCNTGTTIVGAVIQTLGQECRQKSKFWVSWIFRRDQVGFSYCLDLHMHYCATVSASNFQTLVLKVLTRYDSRLILTRIRLRTSDFGQHAKTNLARANR